MKTTNHIEGQLHILRKGSSHQSEESRSTSDAAEGGRSPLPVDGRDDSSSLRLQVVHDDVRLVEFEDVIKKRFKRFRDRKQAIERQYGSLDDYARGYDETGWFLEQQDETVYCWRFRDWLPAADEVNLIGDFNDWSRLAHPLAKEDGGWWSLRIFDPTQCEKLAKEGSRYKLHVLSRNGDRFDRLSPWSKLVRREHSSVGFHSCNGVVLASSSINEVVIPRVDMRRKALRIYEVHVGISTESGTFRSFCSAVLPRVQAMGYNTLLLEGIQECATMGCEPTSFFAVCARLGPPEDLKFLVDQAHKVGIAVLMDMAHYRASSNVLDGLNLLDGTDEAYLKRRRGRDENIFRHDEKEVERFLLSNLRYFLDTFRFDGFRFIETTSMLFKHHGTVKTYNADECYGTYFSHENANDEAAVYLMLANELVHSLVPSAITIAEDFSNYPTLARTVKEGGIGFDFRLATEKADGWRQQLKRARDEEWNLEELVSSLRGKTRIKENVVSLAEGRDQCVVQRRPLLIAFFSWESLHTHSVGGVAPHVTELAAGLQRLGHELHVFVRATEGINKHSNFDGVHYHECVFPLCSDFVGEVTAMCSAFHAEMSATENFLSDRFQIAHAHDWLAAKALISSKLGGHPSVLTMHSTEYGRCGNNMYEGQSCKIRDIEGHACHASDRVICVSGVLAQEVVNMYGVHPDKIKVIYNGIHTSQFGMKVDVGEVKSRYGLAPMDPMFLFVGRMTVQKGPDLLVEAIPSILRVRSDSKFVMVGDGHMKNGLEGRSCRLGIEHAVRWLGKREGVELRELFKAADAVVVPSRNEPFGIVVLEAWSAGTPVVATTCGGPRDFVTPDRDGWLVDPNANSVAWGCCQILSNFPHSQWMGKMGSEKALGQFSWDSISLQTARVYDEQLSRVGCGNSYFHIGDCTISQILFGSLIYEHMQLFDCHDGTARAIALYKMVRLLACSLGPKGGFLNLFGSEFGHPEWIDFPRVGNDFSTHFAKRRWDLADDKELQFKNLAFFDASLMHLEKALNWLMNEDDTDNDGVNMCCLHNEDRVVAFQRRHVLFVFNFHPTQSFSNYRIPVVAPHYLKEDKRLKKVQLICALDTDEGKFGGLDRLKAIRDYAGVTVQSDDTFTQSTTTNTRVPRRKDNREVIAKSISVDLPRRVAFVLVPREDYEEAKRTTPVLSFKTDEFVDSIMSTIVTTT